ncbi:hypothetical protein P154DRAFT_543619 [Amniculicola lignicola CBS 123094]|uniref:Uncharacterized protein n=1 Tax=Amniculicola lignicola CBS 123094 TaxID=1392246 RepID=A0A6A5WXM3_9PLEO|nr:hypothetical protein P154DRAFT_543619 [Amniculicola lignicola CBS 123094]
MVTTSTRWNPFRRRVLGDASDRPVSPDHLLRGEGQHKTWQTTVSEVEGWPEDAKPLKTYNWVSTLFLAGDIVLAFLPIYFMVLGGIVMSLNGKPTKGNDLGAKIEFAITLGPTVFPIVFAAICGRSLKMVARFAAEKGAKISTLELLMASQSVWGTVESQLLLQRLTVVGVNLLFLWALSPLGGQSSLRLMNRTLRSSYESSKIRYVTTGPAGTMWGMATTYEDSRKFADASSLYSAALVAPLDNKLGPRDPWGNVKIPSFEAMDPSTADLAGWISVPTTMSASEDFSSLVGVPLVGLPQDGKSNFSMESTYISVACGKFNQSVMSTFQNMTLLQETLAQQKVPSYIWRNKTAEPPFERLGQTSFFIELAGPWEKDYIPRLDGFVGNVNGSVLNNDELHRQKQFSYVSKYAEGINVAKCSFSQRHVETLVRCNGDQCSPDKVRVSLTDTRPTSFTGFEHPLIMESFARRFAVAVTTRARGSSPTERFLFNSSAFPLIQERGIADDDKAFINLTLISPELFSKRLSLLVNTFYQLSLQPQGYFGSLTTNLSAYGPDTLPVTDLNKHLPSNLSATTHSFLDWWGTFLDGVYHSDAPFIAATTTATVTRTEEVFQYSLPWLLLLFISSGILLAIGSVGLVLKRKTLGPELFGFVAGMTYENPYVKIPGGGSMLDAMERARLLRDVEVCIADVRGDQDVGHIALAAGVPLRKLERGRLYS